MRMENNGVSYRKALLYCGIDFPDSNNEQLQIKF
jgi:hypothetical protein